MEELEWKDITITFCGDGRMIADAEGKKVRLTLSDLNLTNAQTNTYKRECEILLTMMSGQVIQKTAANSSVLRRLRKTFKSAFGMKDDPFRSDKEKGWVPIFKILDRIKAADERAKQRATHVGYDENQHVSTNNDHPFENLVESPEDRETAKFIEKNDPDCQ